jgi:hypothetical protein
VLRKEHGHLDIGLFIRILIVDMNLICLKELERVTDLPERDPGPDAGKKENTDGRISMDRPHLSIMPRI